MNKLPSGWKIEKLENIALVERGKFSVRPRNDPRYFGGNMPFVQTGDISSAKTYLTQYTQTLNEQGISVSKVFPKDTILITIAANIGDTAITTFDVACPDSVVAIQPYKDKANVFWLKQVLETKKAELDAQSTQNAQKNINLQVLKPLIIKTPPLEEQIQIAETLSTWDNAIQTTEKLLENSRQQKKALIQRLLNGKDWKKVKLGNVADMSSGGTPKSNIAEYYNGDILWVSIADMTTQGKYITRTEKTISKLGLENSSAKLYPENTILYAMYASIGECSIATKPITSSQAILGIRPKKELHFEYLYFYLSSLKDKMKLRGQQGTQSNLNSRMVKEFDILLPSFEEQQKIAEILSTADQEIETLQRKLKCLKLEKGALMQRLLSHQE